MCKEKKKEKKAQRHVSRNNQQLFVGVRKPQTEQYLKGLNEASAIDIRTTCFLIKRQCNVELQSLP
ncbi:CLUMA_CG001971, isoform A [Clunio marinus]|uniref:CLUMA_CG001971, isoform A n=1 Tax=Clunio marinus TaxID=568069 RepID=A0A1J1HNY8_9DIPT|nr:CLUMA_CG001971, isoform A [Clunio marinus]